MVPGELRPPDIRSPLNFLGFRTKKSPSMTLSDHLDLCVALLSQRHVKLIDFSRLRDHDHHHNDNHRQDDLLRVSQFASWHRRRRQQVTAVLFRADKVVRRLRKQDDKAWIKTRWQCNEGLEIIVSMLMCLHAKIEGRVCCCSLLCRGVLWQGVFYVRTEQGIMEEPRYAANGFLIR